MSHICDTGLISVKKIELDAYFTQLKYKPLKTYPVFFYEMLILLKNTKNCNLLI